MRNSTSSGCNKGVFSKEHAVDLQQLRIKCARRNLSMTDTRSSYSNSQLETNGNWRSTSFARPSWLSIVRCRICNTNSILGNPPYSFDYTPCRCGKSDIVWKRTQMWALQIDQCNRNEIDRLRQERNKDKHQFRHRATMISTTWRTRRLELGLKCRKTWDGFVRPTGTTKTLHHNGGRVVRYLGRTLKARTLPTPEPNSKQGRFPWLKCKWSGDHRIGCSHRIHQLAKFASPYHFRRSVKEQSSIQSPIMDGDLLSEKFRAEESEQNFEYEKDDFEYEKDDFESNEQVLHRRQGQLDESLHFENEWNDPLPWQPNYTVGSTSSLAVAMLSKASFAYFVMWCFLYCSTLNVVIPELKHLHQYTTITSLVALIIINCFRFQVCRQAFKTQDVYLFTGALMLITLVIILLVSLLTTDTYSGHRRPFNLIISSILLTFLVAEGGAMLWHQRFLQPYKSQQNRK